MKETFYLVSGLLIGYTVGYSWKSANPYNKNWDGLVYVAYPLVAILTIILSIYL